MGRDRSVLFFNFLFPLVFFFVFAQASDVKQSPAAAAQVISMVLVIGILGSGFFGAGMRAVQEREANILRRFKVAPITAAPIIVASLVTGLIAYLPIVIFTLVLANVQYHMPFPSNFLSLLVFVSIGSIAFRAMGMIVAAVVNSVQESQILIQMLYLPMLFLSGATFPVSMMPTWVQLIAQFLPATYLFQGLQSILIAHESLWQNLFSIAALLVTMFVAVFIGTKLFRWEKEEKISGRAKLWILAVLAPFILLGIYQASTRQSVERAKILARNTSRSRTVLFQGAKVFVGDGHVIERGAVLVKEGKIAQVFDKPVADPKTLNADVVNAEGKTIMPGLIDMHVHLGAPGGIYENQSDYLKPGAEHRRLAAYLYSGVTAVRSTGDWLDNSLKLRESINSGARLGAELFVCGPLFTAKGGHGTEYYKDLPPSAAKMFEKQFIRTPGSVAEAQQQVDDLKKAGVDGIKGILESGSSSYMLFNHMDPALYRAVVAEATTDHLPVATHTGNAEDVKLAVDAGSGTVEHGSMTDLIPDATWAAMRAKGVAYDPTLSVFEGLINSSQSNFETLNRSLVQQVIPADLIASTKAHILKDNQKRTAGGKPQHDMTPFWKLLIQNFQSANKAGVTLVTGTDAGNLLVFHGPTVQRELELWVKAGIPAATALQAATGNAAKVLRADGRIGLIASGRDATLILLDGDPLQDISNTERVSSVMFRGERLDRPDLFNQDNN